jgi:hypothetical protein
MASKSDQTLVLALENQIVRGLRYADVTGVRRSA